MSSFIRPHANVVSPGHLGRVLAIDDSPADARLLREMFTEGVAGCELVSRDRLESGLAVFDDGTVDLLLLDLNLPDSCGEETLRLALEKAGDVPIVVLTGLDDEATAISALQAGAQDYLVKGALDARTLRRITRHAIERSRILQRVRVADRLKTQFVSMASHELRTPLSIIREFVALTRDGVGGPLTGDQTEWLDTVLRNCDRLGGLLDDVLDLARIESGTLRLTLGPCDLVPALESWLADFQPRIESRQQALSLDRVEPPCPIVACDAEKIHQVIVNLVENAHKFAPEGGHIVVRVRRLGANVVIEVADDGAGIAPADQARIFEAFTQVDRADGPGAKGTGLGLTIARRIVELHGGAMTVSSESGVGSTFTLTIPVDGPSPTEARTPAVAAGGERSSVTS